MIEDIVGEFVTGIVYVTLKKLLPVLICIVILGVATHSLVAWLVIKRWSSKVAYWQALLSSSLSLGSFLLGAYLESYLLAFMLPAVVTSVILRQFHKLQWEKSIIAGVVAWGATIIVAAILFAILFVLM